MSDKDIERLAAEYRASIEDPPYDTDDAALLRAAAQQARRAPKRRLTYGIAAALVAALGLAAAPWWHTPRRRSSTMDSHQAAASAEAQLSKRPGRLFDDYLTPATLSSGDGGRLDYAGALRGASRDAGQQQRYAESLRKASVVAARRAALACGSSAEVDLNAPGVLVSLKSTKPGDYTKIAGIITGLTRHPELDVSRWIAASFHARGVSYLPLWRTSLPPKRFLSFCLESTRYAVVVTITPNGAQVWPERPPGS
jgi:hypothetical protein